MSGLTHWPRLRALTPARVALPRAGTSVATAEQLRFQLAHAQACDAVHDALDIPTLMKNLAEQGLRAVHVHSAAPDRRAYLANPGLGRRLDAPSSTRLSAMERVSGPVIVIADGLSARAVQRHALPLLGALRLDVCAVVVEQGRVAIGDEIGELLGADMAVVLIGERPGLSSPDSLGVYLTWAPKRGRKDSERNCISNIRPEGLGYAEAAARLRYLTAEARRRGVTGVMLKDETTLDAALPR